MAYYIIAIKDISSEKDTEKQKLSESSRNTIVIAKLAQILCFFNNL